MNYWHKKTTPFCGILNKFLVIPYLRNTYNRYWELGELKVLVLNTKSDMTSKYGTNFFIITHHYKLEDRKIDANR